jgi:predicted MFS family arabinose efflux permease
LTEPIRKEFALSDTQVGFLTTAFTLLYALIGVPLGRIADRASRKKLLAGGVSVWSLLTATTAIASSYGLLLFSRLGVAVGEAVCAPAATSWLGDLFPAEKRSRALAIFMLGVPIGGGLSFLLGGPLAQAFGWRTAMALAAAPALVLVPALLSLGEPARGAAQNRQTIWDIIRIPTLWWIIASGVLLNFVAYAFASFLSSFLIRVHGFSLGATGVAAGLLYGLGGILGGVIAGRVGDWVIHKRKDGRMLAASMAALLSAPLGCLAILQPSAVVAVPLLGLTYCFLTMYYGLVYSSIHDIVPSSLRGAALGFYFMMMYLCGASFGPVITGNLSDRMARRAAAAAGSPVVTEAFKAVGLQQAMLIIPILAMALSMVLYAGSRTIQKDMR